MAFFLILMFNSCTPKKTDYISYFQNPVLYSQTIGSLTQVITHDIFTPPVASRIYAYCNLAAYEAMAAGSKQYQSLYGQLKSLGRVPQPTDSLFNYNLTSLLAFMYVGQELTFSKDSTDKIINNLLASAEKHGMPTASIESSMKYAMQVSNHIISWSKNDRYAETRSASKYSVNNEEGRWVPTPPGYMQAVEPSWMEIRTIAIDSANQFLPRPPCTYSSDKSSVFYKNVNEVYETVKKLTPDQKAIADFWDCNGFKLQVQGHLMFATKAMTPGGHWMGITGILCQNRKADFEKTIYAYTGVSLAIMDAFISCWNTKFNYNLLRPETFINKYMDVSWAPYLQTPPFPEYTSGHSIISKASATVLTNMFGPHTSFRDSTERAWGWPDRSYSNVHEAALEASMSRLYGGIHFRESLEVGMNEGEEIGNFVFDKLRMVKNNPLSQN